MVDLDKKALLLQNLSISLCQNYKSRIMKYLSIVFVAAIALVSCGGEVDACECAAAKAEAGEEAWAADSAANAACDEAMAVEGALDSCEVAAADADADATGSDADAAGSDADAAVDTAGSDAEAAVDTTGGDAEAAVDTTKEG